jgi:hypothetical protein
MQPKVVILGAGLVAAAVIAYLMLGSDDNPTVQPSAGGGSPGVPTSAVGVPTSPAAVATLLGGLTGPTPTPRPGTTPSTGTPSGTTTTGSGFGAVNTAHQGLRSYRVTSQTMSTGTPAMNVSISVQNPDRYHMVIPGSGGAPGIEVIGIGNQSWLKIGTAWQAAPASGAPFQASQFLIQAQGILNSPSANLVGPSTVNGQPCTLYNVGIQPSGSAQVCVGNDNYIRQIRWQDQTTTSTMTFDMFNAVPVINAPL